METVRLAPQARVNLYPWKASARWQPVTSWALWAFSELFQKRNLEK
jgi:hypothetical protein